MALSLESIPRDLQLHALSFCDKQTLAAIPRLSHYWSILTGDDSLWRGLFNLRFQEEMPQRNRCFVAYAKRANPLCLHNLEQLENRIVHFLCNQKWNVKRQFACSFSQNDLYFANMQMSFGPKRGTLEGSAGPSDEVDFFQFTRDLSPPSPDSQQPKGVGFIKFEPTLKLCPEDILFNGEQKGIPFSCSVDCTFPDNLHEGLRFLTSLCRGSLTLGLKVDVGYGNTLGFFSEINEWKSPFKLFCTSGVNGEPVWAGLFPSYKQLKFVLITPQNDVIWEKGGSLEFGNRRLFPHADFRIPFLMSSLGDEFDAYPIEFPKWS